MLKRWRIRRKLGILLGFLFLIVSLMMYSGIHGLYAYRSLVRGLERRLQVLPQAAELSMRVYELRVSLSQMRSLSVQRRQHNLMDNGPPLDTFMAREEFRQRLADVQRSVESYRAKLILTEELRNRIGDSQKEWETLRKIEDALTKVKDVHRDEDWLLDRIKVGQLDTQLDQLQSWAAELPKLLHAEVDGFLVDVKGKYRRLMAVAWVTAASTLLLLGTFVYVARLSIIKPLNKLMKGSQKVADGCFSHRLTVGTEDELQDLADAMNAMTDRFRAVRDDLDRQVQERTKEVVRSERLASVGFLAAGVAHEINNPLAAISFCSESLGPRLDGILDEENTEHAVVRTYLRMIHEESLRCKGITDRLLDFSRIGEVRRQESELRELVQGMVDLVGTLDRYGGRRVELLAGSPVTAMVSSQEIKQVVLNLLTNALDSVEEGGLVTIAIAERDGQAEMIFEDNGCGMTPEVLEHLFEPFFTRKRTGQGTGLGLSITYRIVADHGGTIVATSAGPGRGARFRVTLPLAATEQKENDHRYQIAKVA